MDDSLADDVRALLEGDFGDDRILEQIRRACENGEVISNYERNYVRDLAGRHLRPKNPEPAPRPDPVPDVAIPARLQAAPPAIKRRKPFPRIIIMLAAVFVVAALAAALITSYEPSPGTVPVQEPGPDGPYVRTDLGSYSAQDLIGIEGASAASSVNLVISDGDGNEVWRGEASVSDEGLYKTLTIAAEWDGAGPGSYTVTDGSVSHTFTLVP